MTSALPFFRSMMSVLEVKSTNVRGTKVFRGSLRVHVRHKESRRVPVVAPLTSSRKSRAFLFSVTERLTDFVWGIRMQSHGRSIPIERERISMARIIRVSRRCSTRCPSVGAGLDMVTKKSTLYLNKVSHGPSPCWNRRTRDG